MDKELQKKKTEKKEKDQSLNTILFSSLGVVLLLLVELFLMISMPQMLPTIAILGVVIAGCTYIDLSACIKHIRKKEQEQAEQYESILKSEKASYLLIRKYFDEMGEQIDLLQDRLTEPVQEIIASQKATAKVTINRNKEHTDALMNSNDKLLDLVFELEGKIDKMSSSLLETKEDHSKDENAALLQKQNEISSQMRELELSLKNEILQAVNKLSTMSPQVVMASPQMMQMPQMQQPAAAPVSMDTDPFVMPEVTPELGELGQEEQFEEIGELGDLGALPDFVPMDAVEDQIEPEVLPELQMEEPEPEIFEEPQLSAEPEMILEPETMEEPESIVEDLPPMPDLSDPNKMMSPDDIAALLANMNAEASVVAEEDAVEESIEEPAQEPESVPVEESLPSIDEIDLSDPNRMMSPDEISALLASVAEDTENASSLPDVELEEPEPVVEEAPPMPDLSDPNKMMSPDEIAALFANLG